VRNPYFLGKIGHLKRVCPINGVSGGFMIS
jgi:hypothetical protein